VPLTRDRGTGSRQVLHCFLQSLHSLFNLRQCHGSIPKSTISFVTDNGSLSRVTGSTKERSPPAPLLLFTAREGYGVSGDRLVISRPCFRPRPSNGFRLCSRPEGAPCRFSFFRSVPLPDRRWPLACD